MQQETFQYRLLKRDDYTYFLVSSAKNPALYLLGQGIVHTVIEFDNPHRIYYHIKPLKWLHQNETLRAILHRGVFRFINDKGKIVEDELLFSKQCQVSLDYVKEFHREYGHLSFDVPAAMIAKDLGEAQKMYYEIQDQTLRYLKQQVYLISTIKLVIN